MENYVYESGDAGQAADDHVLSALMIWMQTTDEDCDFCLFRHLHEHTSILILLVLTYMRTSFFIQSQNKYSLITGRE